MLADAVLLDTPRLVDQSLEDASHGFAIQRRRCLPAQAVQHFPLALGVVHGKVVFAFELADREHDLHSFGDELQDATIQVVDASP